MNKNHHLLYKVSMFGRFKNLVFLLFITVLFSLSFQGYAFDIEFKQKDGLFLLKEEADILISSRYIGWARQDSGRKWDGAKIKQGDLKKGEQDFQIDYRRQKVSGQLSRRIRGNVITYDYLLSFNDKLIDTFGGGIQFRLDLSSPRLIGKSKAPQLLSNNRGWSWEIEPGKSIIVKFPPNVANVFFERGDHSKIRVLFFRGNLSPGKKKLKMEVTLPVRTKFVSNALNKNINFSSGWLEDALLPEKTFIDLSYLNEKPAGQHGFVRADGDRLVFEDGSVARFFGVNIQARSLFIKNKALIKAHAQRLARLGVNLVRLHHHDSAIWVRPSLIADGDTTQKLDEKALDSYFWWVKSLREEGIYLWIDLQVQRPWRKGDDIPGWDTDMAMDTKRGMSISKGFIYLNQRMQELTKQFNEALLTRVNPYTNLALKDDPAVMGFLITNENDLTKHYGNKFLGNKGHPYHQALFENEIRLFSKKYRLSPADLGRTWEAGPSKLLLNELEARFNRMMIAHLRSLGVKVPIATTNLWGRNPLFSLPALTTGNVIDTHAYAEKDLLRKNPHFSPNFIQWIGQGQVSGIPMTVSEYNIGKKFVSDDGHIVVLYVSAMAAFQGWDAIMLYGYSQDRFRGKKLSPWSSYRNPAIAGLMPAAALMYRQGHVSLAKKTIVVSPDENSLYFKKISPRSSATLRTLLEQHRLEIAIPKSDVLTWLKPSYISGSASIIRDLNKDMLPDNQNYVLSDTGEIFRDWKKGVLTINTPKTQAAIGEIGYEVIKLADVAFNIRTPKATVILSSLDGRELRHSGNILISTAARVRGVKEGKIYKVMSEIVSGQVELYSEIENLSLRPLLKDGKRGKPIPLRYTSNKSYIFDLPGDSETHWFVIEGS